MKDSTYTERNNISAELVSPCEGRGRHGSWEVCGAFFGEVCDVQGWKWDSS